MAFNPPATSREDYPNESDENATNISGKWAPQAQQAAQGSGFTNPKFRCYLNSLVIALLHIPKFVNFVEAHATSSQEHVLVYKRSCVVCALAGLALEYWKPAEKTSKVEQKLDIFLKLLDAGGFDEIEPWPKVKQELIQQDAAEFYIWLLAVIRSHLAGTLSSAGKERVDELFGIYIQLSITCLGCHKETHRHELPENLLILSCDMGSIEAAIGDYLATVEREYIECDSEKCNNARQNKRHIKKLTQGPDILCTQFLRFEQQWNETNGLEFKKNQQRVTYSPHLNLTGFVKNGTPLRYRLVAAIHHRGDLETGHYITTARTPQGCWVRYDNTSTERVNDQKALQPENFTPFLLFWQKEQLDTPKATTGVTLQTPSKLGKRSHEQSSIAARSENGRPRSKSPKHIGKSPSDNNPPNDEQLDNAPSSWRRRSSNWFFGQIAAVDLEQQRAAEAKQALAHCQKQHKRQEFLIRRAALTHSQLIRTINLLSMSLDDANQAMRTISPFMKRVHARGEYAETVEPFLQAQKAITRARDRNHLLGDKSQPYADLMRPIKVEKGRTKNTAIQAFCDSVREARKERRLEDWFGAELKRLSLPEEEEE
ncbi:MAG: hypothetical protein Q9228_003786 [Teloschistes exilis]